jgi:hypothetical protein
VEVVDIAATVPAEREEGGTVNPQIHDAGELRTGIRRVIPRWEFRHLHTLGRARVGGGLVLTTCGLLTLAFGGDDAKTYGWAAAFLVLAALNLAGGLWELRIARSASRG